MKPSGPTNGTQSAPIASMSEALRYFARLARLIGPYWRPLTKSVLLSTIIGTFALITPYISKVLIDQVYPARDVSLMEILVLAVLVLTVATIFMGAIQTYFAQVIGSELSTAVGLMFFNHLQHLPAEFFDTHPVGEVLSRLTDTRSALNIVTSAFQTVLTNGSYLLLVPPFLVLLNWKLTVLSLIVIPITVTISTAASRLTRRYYKASAEAGAELNAYQMESLSHIRMLKAMAYEPFVYARIRDQSHRVMHASLKAARLQSIVGVCNGLLRGFGVALFTWYAWDLILHDQLTIGGFVAFSAYLGYLTGPVGQFAGLFVSFQQTAVTLGRMFEYLDTAPEQEPSLAYQMPCPVTQAIHGDVVFRNVSFSYTADQEVVRDISVKFSRGTVTAIIGPSGAGKSTLLRMIPQLVTPTHGAIHIDGVSVNDMTLPDLRRQVAVVWQELGLMRGTVLDNLTLHAGTRRSVVNAAVTACGLDELMSTLPRGLETSIAEFGATLSGGQRQRIAIARALIRQTPILLLDEATANIDVAGEESLLARLFASYKDKTIVLVTHRVAVTTHVDQVCLMASGRLLDVGTPQQLRDTSEIYREMLGRDAAQRPRPGREFQGAQRNT